MSDNISIEIAKKDDICEIFKIDELENDAYKISTIEAMFDDEKYILLVAKSCKNVVGYIALSQVLDEAELIKIVVEKEYRGKGVAKRLIQKAIDILKNKGIVTIYLEVRIDNSIARSLYEKVGFVEFGKRAKYYNGVDAVLYRLDLK